MAVYRIGGRTVATAATANVVAASLWNPSATRNILVKEIWIASTTAGVSNIGLLRITARGTPGSTVTPGIASADGREVIPLSGFLLDLATFSVQPTLDSATSYQWRTNLPATIGSTAIAIFGSVDGSGGILIPGGAGLAIVTPTAVILPASDVTFVVNE